MNMMKKAAFTFGETEMTSWPIMRDAIRVAVTLPRLNPANLTGPTVKPIARARKDRELRIGAQRRYEPVDHLGAPYHSSTAHALRPPLEFDLSLRRFDALS